jgi:hypothetical protein
MFKYFAAAVALLLTLQIPVSAQVLKEGWVVFTTDAVEIGIDASSITKLGAGAAQFNIYMIPADAPRAMTAIETVLCYIRKYRFVEIDREPVDREWKSVLPRTINTAMLDFVCDYVK